MEKYCDKKNKNIICKIVIKIIYIILITLILANAIILIKLQCNPNKTPSLFKLKMFCIISGSMEPSISINDVVIIKEVDKNKLEVGDIISFTLENETITHRIINIQQAENNEPYYITKGDANNVEDDTIIRYENIEGKYIFKIPKLGIIITFLQNKTTLIIILTILIILYLLEHHSTDKKEKRKIERKLYEENIKK